MAEQKTTLNEQLQAIANATPHEAYGESVKCEMMQTGKFAQYLLSLDPLKLLPIAVEPPPRQYDSRYGTDGEEKWGIVHWNSNARGATEQVYNMLGQLHIVPQSIQSSEQFLGNFRAAVAYFTRTWNYLIPTMTAIAPRNPIEQASEILKELREKNNQATHVLHGMRDASGKAGLSSESTHFKAAADEHVRWAHWWLGATIGATIIFLTAAFLSLFAYHWIPIDPDKPGTAIHFATSKIIIFVVLAYVVLLCARNYFANRHNTVVNRHRQNALLTYQALVEAAKNTANRDVVLQQAATCIFAPQPTGFTKEVSSEAPSAKSVVELLPTLTHHS